MAQYCRYCSHMVCGDANYCSARKIIFTDKQICNTNTCKEFDLNPIDALGTGKEYRPRPPKVADGQIKFEV